MKREEEEEEEDNRNGMNITLKFYTHLQAQDWL